ncbi:hypothetical protein KKB83_01145 [Patescibacteria group bacterium]|nr:hypothetical protein [Patescibacteria group bacterium]
MANTVRLSKVPLGGVVQISTGQFVVVAKDGHKVTLARVLVGKISTIEYPNFTRVTRIPTGHWKRSHRAEWQKINARFPAIGEGQEKMIKMVLNVLSEFVVAVLLFIAAVVCGLIFNISLSLHQPSWLSLACVMGFTAAAQACFENLKNLISSASPFQKGSHGK